MRAVAARLAVSVVVVVVLGLASGRADGAWIYWTDTDAHKIQRLNTSGGVVEDILTAADGVSDPRGIAIDRAAGKMYWAENGTDRIRRANLDGSQIQNVVTTGLLFPADLALTGGKLYWADRDANAIRRANPDGTGVENVRTGAGVSQPYFLD